MVDENRYDEFAALLQQTTRQLLTYLNAVLFRWDDAEDVFQETCLVLWEKFSEFQPGTNFLAWALCVARNKAMSFQAMQARAAGFGRLGCKARSWLLCPIGIPLSPMPTRMHYPPASIGSVRQTGSSFGVAMARRCRYGRSPPSLVVRHKASTIRCGASERCCWNASNSRKEPIDERALCNS